MAAIITEQFRRNSADTLESDITSNSYYVGIGQQDAWADVAGTSATAPFPVGTFSDQERVLDHLTGLFRINSTNISRVIPRNDLAASTKYKQFDPLDPTCFYTDTTNDIKPCYITVGDQIFLVLQAPVGNAAVDADVITRLGNSFTDYGILSTTSGYVFTYLGRYEQYSDINSTQFIDIGDGSASLSSNDNSTAAFAFVQFTDGTLKLEAQTTGISGNGITVTFVVDESSPQASAIAIAVSGTDITITVPASADSPGEVDLTIDELAQAIRDSIADSPEVNTLITATTLSGGDTKADVESLSESPAVFTLAGSDNLNSYIKTKTGGLVFGFNIIDGGNVYEPDPSLYTEGDTTVTIQADITLHGIDEFGFSRSETITDVDHVIDIATKSISEIRFTDTNFTTDFAAGDILAWKDCRVDISAGTVGVERLEDLRSTSSGILGFDDSPDVSSYAAASLRRDAVIMPKIGPIEGFGFAKFETLPAFYLGLFIDTGGATYIPDATEYHQVSVIKNPLNAADANLTADYVQPLKYFTFPGTQVIPEDSTGGTGDIGAGWQIVQDGKKVGVISHVQTRESGSELSTFRYYYYNDHYYGYEPILVSGETSEASALTFEPPKDDTLGAQTVTTSLTPDAKFASTYQKGTGEVVFIDNRSTVTRAEGQNEELKLIIQL
mgnify:CR=1 FL=1